MTGVRIRSATPADAAAIATVHVDSFLATYPHLFTTHRSAESGREGRVTVWLGRLRRPDPGCTTLVATEDGEIYGFAHVGPDPDDPGRVGQVRSIHVAPERTGTGVGTLLMREARAALAAAGYRIATLWVVADNGGARRFYERLGWQADGGRRREMLAVGDEEGDEVEVIRYRLDLSPGAGR